MIAASFFKTFFFQKLGVPRIGPVGDVIILHDKCCDLALFCGFYRQIDIVPLRLTASQCGGFSNCIADDPALTVHRVSFYFIVFYTFTLLKTWSILFPWYR